MSHPTVTTDTKVASGAVLSQQRYRSLIGRSAQRVLDANLADSRVVLISP